MKIEITQGRADQIKDYDHFEAHRWRKSNDTLILDNLWYDTILDYGKYATYEQMVDEIKSAYKNKTVKSTVSFYESDGRFEIIKKGVFPSIVLWKK